ncbi:protein-L-isoaspartate(D-aspartate) O-methyltransferase [Candidatus Nitrosarchaeum limnium]|jgi:protein-L-isoaspartate(D-aspartate) O-methyltransferase|uniref:Protein-L-isoaspartate O-methyltransferase n=1 Tax=Candidatus Nitrosarchaeum limnium BG20 TaxID=859192 RepID=S2DZZ1_9ARCH|nr:protein-L-isoaspartate(D-aspartate) O-methyltransferase [Candidatus Nitrosarchaeum limnium]EPA04670.1 protein-L-isoaspartate O-methyltransferase [Candidatus Nitrosarchaeum limnium BG20]
MKTNENYQQKLDNLILVMKKSGFLNDKKVELAIRNTPRHEFVPITLIKKAYDDSPILIMKNQTISQPSVVSRMTEWLDVEEGQKILEIGSGSGWQTAILAYLVGCGMVYSVERHSELAEFAKKNLDKLGITNAKVISGDGSFGFPEESPFDRIIITAACKKVPDSLLEQLSINGLLIAPVGGYPQSMVLLKKTSTGIIEIKNQPGYVFVPFLGKTSEDI